MIFFQFLAVPWFVDNGVGEENVPGWDKTPRQGTWDKMPPGQKASQDFIRIKPFRIQLWYIVLLSLSGAFCLTRGILSHQGHFVSPEAYVCLTRGAFFSPGAFGFTIGILICSRGILCTSCIRWGIFTRVWYMQDKDTVSSSSSIYI